MPESAGPAYLFLCASRIDQPLRRLLQHGEITSFLCTLFLAMRHSGTRVDVLSVIAASHTQLLLLQGRDVGGRRLPGLSATGVIECV